MREARLHGLFRQGVLPGAGGGSAVNARSTAPTSSTSISPYRRRRGNRQSLVVPVVRDADKMEIARIEKTIGALGKKAREGRLDIEELQGGTFTISTAESTARSCRPDSQRPQSGILGMHKIQERPVVINGKIEIRPMMYLALSYDHRIVDGKEAVTFLVA